MGNRGLNRKKVIGTIIAVITVAIIAVLLLPSLLVGGAIHPECFSNQFTCATASVNSSGQVSLTLENSTIGPVYNFEVACMDAGVNYTPNPSGFESVSPNGALVAVSIFPGITINKNQTIQIYGLQCYHSNGTEVRNVTYERAFTAIVWIRYTLNATAPSTISNPFYTKASIDVATPIRVI